MLKKAVAVFLCVIMLFSSVCVGVYAADEYTAKTKKVKIMKTTTSAVKIMWSAVSDATGYRIYMKTSGEKWKAVKDTGNTNTAVVKGLSSCMVYAIAVRAMRLKDGVTQLSSTYTSTTFRTVTETTAGTAKLKWLPVSGATGYRVYVKNGTSWKVLKDTSKTEFNVTGLKALRTYQFAIKAGSSQPDGSIKWNSKIQYISATTKALSPTKLSATATVNSVTLKWNAAEGADGYYIYRYIMGSWTVIAVFEKQSKVSTTVKNLKSNTTYAFVVSPYVKLQNGNIKEGAFSNTVKVTTADNNKVTLKSSIVTSSAVRLQWSRAADADGYVIFYYNGSAWKSLKNITSVKTLTYDIKGLRSDTEYTFCIRAYKKGKQVQWFTPSKYCVVTTNPNTSDLKVNRVKLLREQMQGENFTVTYKTYTDEYGYIPVVLSKRRNDYAFVTKVNQLKIRLVYLSGESYFIVDEREAYMKSPGVLSETLSSKRIYDEFIPSSGWTRVASIEKYGSGTAVCETLTNNLTQKSVKFYFKADKLIAVDEVSLVSGKYSRAYIATIGQTASNSSFSIPSYYSNVTDLLSF